MMHYGGAVQGGPVYTGIPGANVGGAVMGGGGIPQMQGGAVVAGGGAAQVAGGGGAAQRGSGAFCGTTTCGPACSEVVACGSGSSPSLQYVGGGAGAYTAETKTEYKFVGAGQGEFDMVKPKPNYCICIVSVSVISLLLLLLLLFLFKDLTATTTIQDCYGCLAQCPAAASCTGPIQTRALPGLGMCSMGALLASCRQCAVPGLCPMPAPNPQPQPQPVHWCVIWGDPHVTTFDNQRVDFYTPGQYWIIKSQRVWVQGEYRPTHATSGLSVMKAIAFGGPFMQGHKLIVHTTRAEFDGAAILPGLGSTFHHACGLDAKYDTVGATMQKGREGMGMHVVHITLPGLQVQINRWMKASEGNYINAKITMAPIPGMDGHCGNFNGNPADDDRLSIRARLGKQGVAASDLIFPGPKIPIAPGNRPDVNDCPPNRLSQAHDECKKEEGQFIPKMSCLIDKCFAGAGFGSHGM